MVHSRYRSSMPSGENKVVDMEIAALRHAGHDVSVFERDSDDISHWPTPRRALLPASVVYSREVRSDLTATIREVGPDVVHVHNTFPLLSPSVLGGAAAAGVPVVASIHNYRLACPGGDFFRDGALCHDCAGTRGWLGVRRGCYRGSPLRTIPVAVSNSVHRNAWRTLPAAYIFVSEAERDALRSLDLPEDRTYVKWNLVPPMAQPCVEPAHRVVFVGRLSESKGVRVLLDAWRSYRGAVRDPRLRLSIVGSGPLESEVRSLAAGDESIDCLGLLTPETCRQVVAGSLALIVPSIWQETFGLVAVEAMSAGVAVVASAIGALPELVRSGREGQLFAPADVSGLARILGDIDARPDHWRALGGSARRSYERRFDPADNVGQLVGIYRAAIDYHSGRATTARAPVGR